MDRESLGEGLESALLDQRLRAEKHKANFEALKAQHLTLQDTHARQKEELEVLAESYDRLAGRSQEIVQTLQSERDAKIVECEELRAQVLTPVKLEQLKTQLLEESRVANKKRVESLESEVEALSRECNGLKYSYAFLKSEYENVQTTHQAVVRELKAKHKAELDAYVEEKRALMARNERDIPTDIQRIRQLQRKNNELQQKVKGLLTENEELRGDKEQVAAATEQSQQVQCQQIAELRAKVKTMELEGSAQSEQVVCLQGELSKARQEVVSLNQQLALSHTELDNHKRRMGDLEHEHSLEVSELKMKQLDVCRELEEERESCVREIKSLQSQVEVQRQSLEAQNTLLTDKERQVEQRVQAAREKEWEKLVSLEREKIDLETTVAELQQQLSQLREECDNQVGSLEDRVRELNTAKSGVESELELLKSQSNDKSRELQSVMMEMKQVAVVNRKYQSLLSEHRKLESVVDELRASGRTLEERLSEAQTQWSAEKEGWSREREKLTQDLSNERRVWESEREGLLTRLQEGQTNRQSLEQQLTASKATNKKLQRHYKKQIGELERSVEVLRAEQETTRTEKQALESSLSLENQKLQRKLSDMLRKQKEFLFLLNNHPQSTSTPLAQHSNPEPMECTQDIDTDNFE